MAYDPIAQARIELELNDDAVIQGLQRVQREHDRTMRDIDRSSAEATVDVDVDAFEDGIRNVKRQMAQLRAAKADPEVKIKDKEFKRRMRALRKELVLLTGRKATIELDVKGEEKVKRAQERIFQATKKRIEAEERLEAKRERIYEQAERRRLAGIRQQARTAAALNKQRERELAQAHQWALRLNREQDQAAAARERELRSIPKLQREYASLRLKMEGLAKARRKAFPDRRSQIMVDLQVAETEAKMRALVAELERIGADVDVRIDFKRGARLGRDIRNGLLGPGGGLMEAGYQAGRGIGRSMVSGLLFAFSPRNIGNRVTNTFSKLGDMLGSFASATVRIGPFTASVKTLLGVLAILGPTIVDIVGALGALVGVVGTGLAGAMALSAGAIGAWGLSLGGVFGITRTLMRDFKSLRTIQKAYNTAVLKFGADSGKAKAKLEEFNNALGEVQPTTREAFMSIDKLKERWNKMAQEVKPDFFDAIGATITTINKRFEWFGKNSQAAFRQVVNGWEAWMRGLRGEEAGEILERLGRNGNKSLRPLMDALGNLFTWFGRIAAEASSYLPGLMRQFRGWSQSLADSVGPSTNLADRLERLVEHTRSLGRFLSATGGFLVSFFNGGADAGESFLDVMTRTLNGWTRFNESVEGRAKLDEFFTNAVEGTKAFYNALKPLVVTFVAWANQMSPWVADLLNGVGAISGLVLGFVKLVGLQDSMSALVTTVGALWAVGRIKTAVAAVSAFSTALLGLGGASAAAGAGGAAGAGAAGAGGLLGLLGLNRQFGPNEKKWVVGLKNGLMGAVRVAGFVGVGILIMQMIGKGFKTAKAREGFESTILGLSRDVLNVLSFGIADSADETSKKAMDAIMTSLRNNARTRDLDLSKNIKFGGSGLNKVTTLDLKIDDRKVALNFQKALQSAARLAQNFNLPDISVAVKIKSNPQDFNVIEQNMSKLRNNLTSSYDAIKKNTDETMAAMKRSMDMRTSEAQMAVGKNMQLTVQQIRRNMDKGGTSAAEGMSAIRRSFRVHSAAAARTADTNFGHAKTAIQNAVKQGQISSEKGLAEIRKLWVSYLKLYGFSEKEASNMSKGNSYTGGPEEGTRGPGRSGTQPRARGGLVNIGVPGQRGHDSVPMNLGGVPSIVAPGEQIAVFNRHQQKAINSYVPGGLEGFFTNNKRPHHYAGGGIVPVPGFPGERASSSILDEIAWVAKTFGLILTDAFGPGHKSPGHTQFGTAADFGGPDASMDAAVRALVSKGYIVGYDGRFGSMDWPGHGPAAGQGGSNAHLHVEFGGKGGGAGGLVPGAGLVAEKIKRQMATTGFGLMTDVPQRVLDTVLGAAQKNLDGVAAQSLTIPMTGGHGVGPGKGAASRSQMVAWATEALTQTAGLGHGGATAGNISKILELAMKESSWIVNSMNNWDSNAKAGNPSGGLMHVTIDKVGRSIEALHDPVLNMIASIRYQMSRYKSLITFSPYAQGGIIDTMSQSQWARGGKVERPTLMTGEDGKKSPEYVIGTNPSYRANNITALTNAANALGVPMARKSKTGTVKPSLATGVGKDPGNLKEVRDYDKILTQEETKRRQISIAESKVKEPDTLIKQQGTDAAGNPLFVVDQAKINSYVAMMQTVKDLYDDLINKIMVALGEQAQRAYAALDTYRSKRTLNISVLDQQNAINKKLMKSKDKHTAEAAERRYNAGIEMREQQVGLRNDAQEVRGKIVTDQRDARFRVQEYDVARQSVIDDISAVGTKAAADAAAETKSEYKEPDEVEPGPSPGQSASDRLETELALAKAGYGTDGKLGSQRDVKAIIADLIAANELRIAEAQAMLTDADTTNDQEAYSAITQAANAITGLRDDLKADTADKINPGIENANFGGAMLDLFRNFGGNMIPNTGIAAGSTVSASFNTNTAKPFAAAAPQGGAPTINIEQNFPAQPDPMTWAETTKFELQAAL